MTDLQRYDNFCEAAMLNRDNIIWIHRRDKLQQEAKNGELEFAWFKIVAVHDFAWWAQFDGLESLGMLPGRAGSQDEVYQVQGLGNVRIRVGRGILKTDITLL